MAENPPNSLSLPLAAAFIVGTATIAGAWFFELVMGLPPCPMCLTQRWPYYIGLPVLVIALMMVNKTNKNVALICALGVAVLFLAGAVFAGFHTGVEWHFWKGPADCSGGEDLNASIGNLLQDLKTAKVVSCVDAAWRLFGISLAGYNVLISALISGLCFIAFLRIKKS